MKNDVLLEVNGVLKKYCRNLRHSMWYAVKDVLGDTVSFFGRSAQLRPYEFWAVNNVSFELKRGECLGLIGPNGAGKSTLLKLINGIMKPDLGTIKIRGRLGALIELGAGFHPQLTGLENIYINAAILGMSKSETDAKLKQIIEFAELGDFLGTPVKFYSSGMVVRLGMAVALHTDPKILLIDEVLAVGDIRFQAKCLNRIAELKGMGVSFIFVSHNQHHVAGHSDRVLVLDQGQQRALDEPKVAIEKYLELLNEKSDGQTGAKLVHPSNSVHPNGSGRIRLDHAYFCDDLGNTVTSIDATKPLALRITYEADSDFSDVELDIVVIDGKRGMFFQGTNLMYNQPLHIVKGTGCITVRFPFLPKNNAQLQFSIALWAKGRHELFDWREELFLYVKGCSLSPGTVWLTCSFQASVQTHDGENLLQAKAAQSPGQGTGVN